jgi:hypothetical protein
VASGHDSDFNGGDATMLFDACQVADNITGTFQIYFVTFRLVKILTFDNYFIDLHAFSFQLIRLFLKLFRTCPLYTLTVLEN